MTLELAKRAIDLGIVVRDKEAALRFYRDTLALEFVEESDMGNGTKMQRLMCGDTMIKLQTRAETPAESNPPGGPAGALGIRYWTISVTNIEVVVAAAKAGGYAVPRDVGEIRPGVRIAMIEDPDGNWVELLQNDG